MMKRVALLLALLSVSFAAGCEIASGELVEAMPIIGAAIMLSVAVSALAYMAGSLMRDPRLLVFSKDQVFHTFVSVLLVLCIQGIFAGTCMMASQVLGGADMLDVSLDYLRALRVDGGNMLVQIMKTSIEKKFDAVDFFGYHAPFLGGENFWYSAYNNAYSRHLEILFDIVMAGYISAGVQYQAMLALDKIALGLMVPAGLVLRSIPKAREAGNIVLALALAAYVVLPFAYAVNSTIRVAEVPWFTGETDDTGISFEAAAMYILQTVFLPNLSLVVFATSVGGLIKVAKVIP